MAEINEIISKEALDGIKKTDEAITNLDQAILKILGTISELSKKLKEEKVTLDDLTKASKANNNTKKEVDQIEKKLISTNKTLIELEDERTREIIKNQQQIRERRKQITEEIKSLDDQAESINKLRKENRELVKVRNQLSTTSEEGRKEIQRLNSLIDENNQKIKENSDQFAQTKINIGNYQESIEKALKSTNAFSGGASQVVNNFIQISEEEGGIKKFFATTTSGLKGATRAALKFIATPIGAVITAIVAGIAAFNAVLKRNEGASDIFKKVWTGVTTVINELISRIFTLGKAVGELFKGNFKKAAQTAKEAFTDLGGAIRNAYEEGSRLIELTKQFELANIANTKSIAELNAESEKYNVIAEDTTLSFAAREAAAERARVAEQKSAQLSVDLARRQQAIVDQRVETARRQGTITRELQQEQADLIAATIEAESRLTQVTIQNNRTRSELKQDRLERDLDILLDGFDNVKTINEQIIADDTRTYEERKKLLEQTIALGQDSFDSQIETIRKFTKVQFDENDLIATQDSILLNQKIRNLGLSEIIEGRLLEIIRDRRSAIQDLSQAERELDQEREEETRARVQLEQEALDVLKDLETDFLDEVAGEEQDNYEERKKAWEKYLDDKLEKAKEEAEKEKELQEETVNAINELQSSAFDLANSFIDRKIGKEDQARQLEIARAENSAMTEEQKTAAKERINEKYDQKIAELQKKQATNDKLAALFNIGIQIPINAAKALEKDPTGVLAAIVTAIGLAQLGIVAAQPIPQFWMGTENTPYEFTAAERGRELMQLSSGDFMMVDQPTYFKGSTYKGAKIFPNKQTEEIMNFTKHSGFSGDPRVVQELKGLRKDIKSMPQPILEGNVWGVQRNRTKVRMLNKYQGR